MDRESILKIIIDKSTSFEEKALINYEYQYTKNQLYRQFVNLVRYNGFKPKNVSDIPFLPISLYKSNVIKAGVWEEENIFYSSGTTLPERSRHFIRSLSWYLENAADIWQSHFGSIGDHTFLSLLPNYHENPSSSLIAMVSFFMKSGRRKEEAYFLDNYERLNATIEHYNRLGGKVVLFGVSFALLDYARRFRHENCQNLKIVETGGMKKHRKEITRSALHDQLKSSFAKAEIISEYGMTECLSQLYCVDSQYFIPNHRMRILISDPTDPIMMLPVGKRGRINIIDLANIDTMSFLATDDLGMSDNVGRIEVYGRLSNSDLRGCNYLL